MKFTSHKKINIQKFTKKTLRKDQTLNQNKKKKKKTHPKKTYLKFRGRFDGSDNHFGRTLLHCVKEITAHTLGGFRRLAERQRPLIEIALLQLHIKGQRCIYIHTYTHTYIHKHTQRYIQTRTYIHNIYMVVLCCYTGCTIRSKQKHGVSNNFYKCNFLNEKKWCFFRVNDLYY